MNCCDVAVMRRKSDSFLNATQILKVAGIEKGRRTKILEREIVNGIHEKVQGGYGKYQGTWIPFHRGVQLAIEYKVDKHIREILVEDTTFLQSSLRNQKKKNEEPTTFLHRPAEQQGNTPLNSLLFFQDDAFSTPISFEDTHRNALMSVFLTSDLSRVPDLLRTPSLNVNMAIDVHGNTPLHWAAALSRMQILEALVFRGAQCNVKNYVGETPLMCAVAVTNCFDSLCFDRLLCFLISSATATDSNMRTVFHHISLTSSRTECACYYLSTVLNTLRPNVISQLIDLQDFNGDSALSIALRLNSNEISSLLVAAGARNSSVYLPNLSHIIA